MKRDTTQESARLDLVGELRDEMNDSRLLEKALTHGSWANSVGQTGEDYERLEFLGDAVIGAVVVEYLYRHFPEEPEGNLSRTKAWLVSSSTLARLARASGLDQHIRLSGSPEGLSKRGRDSIHADVFESVTGAMFLDLGFEATRSRLRVLFRDIIEEANPQTLFADYKSSLQERTQGVLHERPRYEVERESGPSHKPVFHAKVWVDDTFLGEGRGPSKKLAEQEAAAHAVARIEEGDVTLDELLRS